MIQNKALSDKPVFVTFAVLNITVVWQDFNISKQNGVIHIERNPGIFNLQYNTPQFMVLN